MKNVAKIVSLILFSTTLLFAQNYKKPAVTVLSDGSVMQAGVKIGTVDAEGNIMDIKGKQVAKVVEDPNHEFDLVDNVGNKMGHIMSNGNFKDSQGKKVYLVEKPNAKGECAIKDGSGKVVGFTHKNYKRQGECAAYCVECGLLKKE